MKRLDFLARMFAVGVAVALGFACGQTAAPTAEVVTPPTGSVDRVEVDQGNIADGTIELDEVVREVLPEELRVAGRIAVNENHTVRVGALVDGRISDVFFNVGDLVKEGERLAYLRSHVVHEYRAEFAKAQSQMELAESELELSKNLRDRASRLYELKAGSLEQVQKAEADFQYAQRKLDMARVEIGRIRENLHHLGLSAESAVEEYREQEGADAGEYDEAELVPILSPIQGTVLERLITPGTVVSPADDLYVVSDLRRLWVFAEVPETNLGRLRAGHPVKIYVDAYGSEPFFARLSYVGDVLNRETRTVQVRCEADNSAGRLRPEMYSTVSFDLSTGQKVVTVPASAVQNVEGNDYLFSHAGGGVFRVRKVQIGRRFGSRVELISGLEAGERVAGKGSFLLKSELLKGLTAEE